jgi:hypothetical protein
MRNQRGTGISASSSCQCRPRLLAWTRRPCLRVHVFAKHNSSRAGMPRCGSTGRLAPLPPPSCSVNSQPRPRQGYLTASRCGSRNCCLKGQSNLRVKKRSVCDRRAQAAWACLCQCTQIQFFFNLSRRDLEGMYTAADLFACKEFRLACSGKVATSTTRLRDNCPIYFKE